MAAEARTGVCRTVALISDFTHPSMAGAILYGVLATASKYGFGAKIYNTAA